MTLNSQEIFNYCEVQKKTFEALNIPGDFNKGIIEGINLVKVWVEILTKGEQDGRD